MNSHVAKPSSRSTVTHTAVGIHVKSASRLNCSYVPIKFHPRCSSHRAICWQRNRLTIPFSALSLSVGRQKGHPGCEKCWVLVCWWGHSDWSFAPPPSSLAPIKSRMETFWYQLTLVHLEKRPLKRTERNLTYGLVQHVGPIRRSDLLLTNPPARTNTHVCWDLKRGKLEVRRS